MPRQVGTVGSVPGSSGSGPPAVSSELIAHEFVRTFNQRDLDGFEAVLAPEVEIHSMRGLLTGRKAAREWATRPPGGVQQTIVIETTECIDDRVLLEIRREWRWDEDGDHASTDEMAWLFEICGGRVASWRPFEDRAEARRVFTGA